MTLVHILWRHRRIVGSLFPLVMLLTVVFGLVEFGLVALLALFIHESNDSPLMVGMTAIFGPISDFDLSVIVLIFAALRCILTIAVTMLHSTFTAGLVARLRMRIMTSVIFYAPDSILKENLTNLISRECERVGEAFTYIIETAKRCVLLAVYFVATVFISSGVVWFLVTILGLFLAIAIAFKGKLVARSKILLSNTADVTRITIQFGRLIDYLRVSKTPHLPLGFYQQFLIRMRKIQASLDFINRLVKQLPEALGALALGGLALFSALDQDVQFIELIFVVILFQRIFVMVSNIQFQLVKLVSIFESFKTVFASLKGEIPIIHDNPSERYDTITVNFDDATIGSVKLTDSLTLERGKKYLIRGPSGIGKSSLLRCFLKEDTNNGVRISIDKSAAYFDDGGLPIPRVGLMPQENNLLETTLAKNISMFDRSTENDLAKLYELVGIDPQMVSNNEIILDGRLSGGQMQRVCLARAIHGQPDLLILDEPTSALDDISEKKIFEALKDVESIGTILVVSHNSLATPFFDYVIDFDIDGIKLRPITSV